MLIGQRLWICCEPFQPQLLTKKKLVIIGRSKDCALVLPHNSVSRHHAIARFNGKNWVIDDAGSSNGTHVNGKKIKSHNLIFGDKIQIGPYELLIKENPYYSNQNFNDTLLTSSSQIADVVGQIRKKVLVEIFQSIEFNEKTGTLFVADGLEDGFIIFERGRPLFASYSEVLNQEAIIEILKLRQGSFMIIDKVEPTKPAMNTSFTNILLEYFRIDDELNQQLESCSSDDLNF